MNVLRVRYFYVVLIALRLYQLGVHGSAVAHILTYLALALVLVFPSHTCTYVASTFVCVYPALCQLPLGLLGRLKKCTP